jgi:hypothetical protein
MVPDEKPQLEVKAVVAVMQELIPALTREMEALVNELRARSPPLATDAFHRELSKQYIARSGELTARACGAKKMDVREFQRALLFYHDDPAFSQALAKLSAAQQKKCVSAASVVRDDGRCTERSAACVLCCARQVPRARLVLGLGVQTATTTKGIEALTRKGSTTESVSKMGEEEGRVPVQPDVG